MDSQSVDQTSNSQTSNPRRKADPTWEYYCETPSKSEKCKTIICQFCNQSIFGGEINLLKQHLAGINGNVKPCPKVTSEVRFQMKTTLAEIGRKKNENTETFDDVDHYEEDDIHEIPYSGDKKEGSNKRKRTNNIENYMKGNAGIDSSQPSIQACMQSRERWHDTNMAIALWFYDSGIPLNAANSPYFQAAISRIATMGHGYTGPTYYALRFPLLRAAKTQVQLIVDSFRAKWIETGCTIMADSWTDNRQRSLVNFLVYCSSGISFIKSVDISIIEANAENLCNLFVEIVEIVGPKNVVHVVTNNSSNYKSAGRLLSEKYPTICWSPCAAHCINLIMKDIYEMRIVNDLVILASRISIFIYNHKWSHAWLRKRPGWTEIIRPGDTRFGTMFIALKSLYDHKEHLQAMVTSQGFKRFLGSAKAKEVKQIILNEKFCSNCLIISKIMAPIMRLLRICASDEKPSLGYVYDGMLRVIKSIIELFRNKERYYGEYIDKINARWDKMLRKNLHAAAFWLNPTFQYDPKSPTESPEVMKGLLDVIEMHLLDVPTMVEEIIMFRERQKSFGRALALKNSKATRPDEWWRVFGSDAPNLQKLAIKILSQTSSSSGCERNWSVFEHIHTMKRNRLEHARLNDLVFVHYNLRLQHRLNAKKRSYDPIDYECIDEVEFWVVDEAPSGELDYDELEEMLEEDISNNQLRAKQSKGHASNENEDEVMGNDDINLSKYGDVETSSNEIGDLMNIVRSTRFDESL